MIDILDPASRPSLEAFRWADAVMAFDFDGTLAPLSDRPCAAELLPRTRELLTSLARRSPCLVLSGRARTDVMERLRGIGLLEVIGNHGLEMGGPREDLRERVRSWLGVVRAAVADLDGVLLEDKGLSLSVHYRRARQRDRALRSVLEVASKLSGVRVVGGKDVVNLVPDGAGDKGTALLEARDRLGFKAAVYVGDDETDEDVFARGTLPDLLGVHVGPGPSRAPYFVRDQASIDRLLELFLELRGIVEESQHGQPFVRAPYQEKKVP